VAVAAAVVLLGAILFYEAALFLLRESTLSQLSAGWNGSALETIYADLPGPRSYFGYPKREGWKTVGVLRAEGNFPGDFRSMNEDFIVPIWYNFGQARSCYTSPAHFFVRAPGAEIPATVDNYVEVGQVSREAEVRLHVLSSGAAPESGQTIYAVEAYEQSFDRLATPGHFARQAESTVPVGTQFERSIQFEGYDLPSSRVAPGDSLQINLYWRALDSPGDNFRAFVHLTDGARLWGQQDDTPACRLPTSVWRPQQRGVGQFRLPIDPDTPPGRYPLIIGLYQADTLERLKIISGTGQPGDDFLWLLDIEVVEAPGAGLHSGG
jgi:hypothetical protein